MKLWLRSLFAMGVVGIVGGTTIGASYAYTKTDKDLEGPLYQSNAGLSTNVLPSNFKATVVKHGGDVVNDKIANVNLKNSTVNGKDIDKWFESQLGPGKGVTPDLIIYAGSVTFNNEYTSAIKPSEFIEFVQWFFKNVSWGPELSTLSTFSIVRGVDISGGVVKLGGHEGAQKESTNIKFYPDAFFGTMPIYSPYVGQANKTNSMTSRFGKTAEVKDIETVLNKVVPYYDSLAKDYTKSRLDKKGSIGDIKVTKEDVENSRYHFVSHLYPGPTKIINGIRHESYQTYAHNNPELYEAIAKKFPYHLKEAVSPVIERDSKTGKYSIVKKRHKFMSLTERIPVAEVLSLSPEFKGFGTSWLHYVAAHEYGHHQTLNAINDLAENRILMGSWSTRSGPDFDGNGYNPKLVNMYLKSRANGLKVYGVSTSEATKPTRDINNFQKGIYAKFSTDNGASFETNEQIFGTKKEDYFKFKENLQYPAQRAQYDKDNIAYEEAKKQFEYDFDKTFLEQMSNKTFDEKDKALLTVLGFKTFDELKKFINVVLNDVKNSNPDDLWMVSMFNTQNHMRLINFIDELRLTNLDFWTKKLNLTPLPPKPVEPKPFSKYLPGIRGMESRGNMSVEYNGETYKGYILNAFDNNSGTLSEGFVGNAQVLKDGKFIDSSKATLPDGANSLEKTIFADRQKMYSINGYGKAKNQAISTGGNSKYTNNDIDKIFSDYTMLLPEVLTRDLVQITYRPDTHALMPGLSSKISEANTGFDFYVSGSYNKKWTRFRKVFYGNPISRYSQQFNHEYGRGSLNTYRSIKSILDGGDTAPIKLSDSEKESLLNVASPLFGKYCFTSYDESPKARKTYLGDSLKKTNGYFLDRFIRKEMNWSLYEDNGNQKPYNGTMKDLNNKPVSGSADAFWYYLLKSKGIGDRTLSGLWRSKERDAVFLYGYVKKELGNKIKYLSLKNNKTGLVQYIPVNIKQDNLHYYTAKNPTSIKTLNDEGFVSWSSDFFSTGSYRNAVANPGDFTVAFVNSNKEYIVDGLTLGSRKLITENGKTLAESPTKIEKGTNGLRLSILNQFVD